MSEGRTSAAQAAVEGEDRPADAPASTGTTGAGAVTGSGGTNGHGTEDTTSDATSTAATTTDATTGDATTGDATTGDATTGDATTGDATTGDATTVDATTSDAPAADATTTDEKADETAHGTTSGADEPGGGDTVETVPAATLPGAPSAPTSSAPTSSAATSSAATSAADGHEEWADAEDKAYKREMRKGFAFGAAGGIVIGAIVALLLGALVWPGYLLGPGDPQDTANQVTQALSAKDAGALDALSCKGPNGQPVTQLSPQVLQYITKVAPAGPTTTLIDTEARTPIDLTLSVQGQTQTLPSELVLGETKGDWCLKGLAQRQQ